LPVRPTRFAVAVHILALLAMSPEYRFTSEFIARSVNTNPTFVRRVIGLLVRAGLVETVPGVGGTNLTRPPQRITLLDIYRAVQGEEPECLFAIHERPNELCPVGCAIKPTLEKALARAEAAMEEELDRITLTEIAEQMRVEAAAG